MLVVHRPDLRFGDTWDTERRVHDGESDRPL